MPHSPQDLYQLSNDTLSVGIAALGAELQFLRMRDGRDLLWDGQAQFWSGRAPILFPIVGRAPDDMIAVNGKIAQMKQHGFARRSIFGLQSADEESACFVLKDCEESRAVYPFRFQLSITYRLSGPTLTVTVAVANTDTREMPFGLGFHPAFAWPLPGAEGAEHVITLDNQAEPPLARLDGGFLDETPLPSPFKQGRLALAHDLFEADAMIFPKGSGEGLRYEAPGTDAPVLQFRCENTPNLGIWTKPGAPFICIEPWHGMAARIGDGPEIADRPSSVLLGAGETAHFGYSVTIK